MAIDDHLRERRTPAPYDVREGAHYESTKQVFRHSAVHKLGYYDAHPGKRPTHSIWQRRVRRIVLSMLVERLHGDAILTILDVGCGRGDLSIEVARRHPQLKEVWGTDFVPEALTIACAEARRLQNVFFRDADILNMPFEDKAFDATLCINVLHHIHAADLRRALGELARITKQCLILEVKNRKNFYYKNRPFRYADPVGRVDIFPTSTAEVSAGLNGHGFRLAAETGIFPLTWLSPLLVLRYEHGH